MCILVPKHSVHACTGRRRGTNRWEVHSNEAAQSELVVFFRQKYGLDVELRIDVSESEGFLSTRAKQRPGASAQEQQNNA